MTESTRFRENEIPNLLDLILSSDETMIQDLTYHPPLGESDRICLKCKLLYQQNEEFIPIHNVFKTNYNIIKETLSKKINILTSALESNSPKPAKKKKTLNMTSEAIRIKDKKVKLWRKYVRTRNKFDRDNYIKCKNRLRSLTRNLRSEFERNLDDNIKNNPKSFWKYDSSRHTIIGKVRQYYSNIIMINQRLLIISTIAFS